MLLNPAKKTKNKVAIANVLYRLVKLAYRTDKQQVRRNGLQLELHLNEGIDLHTFLFGSFQQHVYSNKLIKLAQDAIVFDVGANIGLMALSFAQLASKGMVYAFEPTHYALKKLERNLELNPELKQRIVVNHCFVSSSSQHKPELVAYSSWPLGHSESPKHEVHCGVAKNTDNVHSISLDDFASQHAITRLDLIKTDTDGHEYEVLCGATKVLGTLRPKLIIEVGQYVMKERGVSFEQYHQLLAQHHYLLYTPGGKLITPANYARHIPTHGTIDMIAIPQTPPLP